MVEPLFRLVDLPDWAIQKHNVLKEIGHEYRHFDHRMGPWNDYNGDRWCRLACAHGDLATLKLFVQAGHSPHLPEDASYVADSAHCIAARGGHLDILQWLLSEGYESPSLEKLLETAVISGEIKVAQWLASQLPEDFVLETMRYHCYWDVKKMDSTTIDWLVTAPCVRAEFDVFAFALQAAEHGCIDLLRLLHRRDPNMFDLRDEWDVSILGEAVNHGQVDTVKCLLHEFHVDAGIIVAYNVKRVVEGGYADVLEVLSSVRPDFFEMTEQLDMLLVQSARYTQPTTLEWVLGRLRSRERGVGDLTEILEQAKRNTFASTHMQTCHLLGLEPFVHHSDRHG
ncbi:hypothetical protein PINS_up002585 [Pythium insidiosum]|nr:hypothetical protein PINS_up002585 [Pythium insidiosum]